MLTAIEKKRDQIHHDYELFGLDYGQICCYINVSTHCDQSDSRIQQCCVQTPHSVVDEWFSIIFYFLSNSLISEVTYPWLRECDVIRHLSRAANLKNQAQAIRDVMS